MSRTRKQGWLLRIIIHWCLVTTSGHLSCDDGMMISKLFVSLILTHHLSLHTMWPVTCDHLPDNFTSAATVDNYTGCPRLLAMFTLLLHVDDDIYIIIITWRSSFQSDPLLCGPSSGGKQELNSKISCVWRKIENVMNVCSDPQNYQQQLHANSSPHHHHLSVQMLHQWTLFLVVFNYDQLQVFNEKTLLFVLASWLIISSEWSFSVFA